MTETLVKKTRSRKKKSTPAVVQNPISETPKVLETPEITTPISKPRLDQFDDRAVLVAIMNTMRILKPKFMEDTFYETYQGMIKKYPDFFDVYMLAWNIGATISPKRVLEVGARAGTAFCQLWSAYLHPEVLERAVLVDPFTDGFCSAQRIIDNIKHLYLPYDDQKVTVHEEMSQSFLPSLLGQKFDYILIDGDHDYGVARMDLENSVPLCAEGGIIAFDDISNSPGECGLITVFEDFADSHKDEFEFYTRMEGKGTGWCIKL
jgi:hypothetical protein